MLSKNEQESITDLGDEDFADLEALINPRPKPDAGEPDPVDELDELEALLGEALADKKTAEAVKAARAKAKSGYGLSADDLERIRKWELAREWQPTANVAFFKRYECACGRHQTVFEALMLEQRHRTQRLTHRWTKIETEVLELPKRAAIRKTWTPLCQVCTSTYGYPLAGSTEWQA